MDFLDFCKHSTNTKIKQLEDDKANLSVKLAFANATVKEKEDLNSALTKEIKQNNSHIRELKTEIRNFRAVQTEEINKICEEIYKEKIDRRNKQHKEQVEAMANTYEKLRTEQEEQLKTITEEKDKLNSELEQKTKFMTEKELKIQKCLKNKKFSFYISIFGCLLLVITFILNMCFISARSTLVNENDDVSTQEIFNVYDQVNSFLSIFCVISLILKIILVLHEYNNPCDDSKRIVINSFLCVMHLSCIVVGSYLFVKSQSVTNDKVRNNVLTYSTVHLIINSILLVSIILDVFSPRFFVSKVEV
jgi:hypothetical protein